MAKGSSRSPATRNAPAQDSKPAPAVEKQNEPTQRTAELQPQPPAADPLPSPSNPPPVLTTAPTEPPAPQVSNLPDEPEVEKDDNCSVLLELPLADRVGHSGQELGRLSHREAIILGKLASGLAADKHKLADGRPIESPRDAVRWIAQQLLAGERASKEAVAVGA